MANVHKEPGLELRQLECFIAVAEELHFGRAARRLCMTQSPLSRQIQRLEQALGTALFDRSSRHVALTAAGRGFLLDARHLLAFSMQAGQAARAAAMGEAGQISFGFTAVAAYREMPDMVRKSREVLPGLVLQLREMVSTELSRLLLSGELDLVLMRQQPHDDSLRRHLVRREPLLLALPAGSPLAQLEAVPLSALHGQPFVLYSPNEGKYFHDRIVGALGLANVTPGFVQWAGQTHTLVALVAAGLGVGIVPASVRALGLRGVVYRPLLHSDLVAELYLTWRHQNSNPALHAFLSRVLGILPQRKGRS